MGKDHPRQRQITLVNALEEAVRVFRAEAAQWKNQNGIRGPMDKSVRRAIAAEHEERARLIEVEITRLAHLSPNTEDRNHG